MVSWYTKKYMRGGGRVNKTELLDRCARSGEERTLLARVLDKLERMSR